MFWSNEFFFIHLFVHKTLMILSCIWPNIDWWCSNKRSTRSLVHFRFSLLECFFLVDSIDCGYLENSRELGLWRKFSARSVFFVSRTLKQMFNVDIIINKGIRFDHLREVMVVSHVFVQTQWNRCWCEDVQWSVVECLCGHRIWPLCIRTLPVKDHLGFFWYHFLLSIEYWVWMKMINVYVLMYPL